MKLKEESKKAGLKLNIQKVKIMAPGPITPQQIDGETKETVTDFIFLGFKFNADGDCSHEIKKCLLVGRKAMTNLASVLESRDITLPLVAQLVKNPPTMWETWVRSLGWEDPLEMGKATHSCILAWRIP